MQSKLLSKKLIIFLKKQKLNELQSAKIIVMNKSYMRKKEQKQKISTY